MSKTKERKGEKGREREGRRERGNDIERHTQSGQSERAIRREGG